MLVRSGLRNGIAFVHVASEKDVAKALTLDKQYLGERYIEGERNVLILFLFESRQGAYKQ